MSFFGTLRRKTFAAVMLINFLAIAAIAVFFQQRATSFFEEEYADSLYDGIHIGGKALDEGFQTVYRIALEASFDARIKEIAEQGDPAALQKLSLLLQQYKAQSPLVDAVYCYLPARGILVKANGYRPVATLPPEERTVWAETIARQTGLRPLAAEDMLGAARKKVLLYHAAVHSGDAVIADLTYTVSERGLYYAYLDDFSRDESRDVLLLDGARRIVSGSRLPDTAETAEIGALVQDAPAGRGSARVGGERCTIAWAELPFSGMTLLLVEKQDRLLHQILLMQLMTVLCALVIAALSAVFLYAVSARISAPVEELAETMKAVGRGDLDVRAAVRGKDEIGYLAAAFNRMLSHIESLVERLAGERVQKKEAELKALQYQIRPHFIYNTLNAIRLAALMQGAKNIAALLGSFIEILRVSTNREGSFAPLRDEIATLRSYIALQEFRMMDVFSVTFDLAQESLACCVPRLILQPLVENSILHAPSEERPSCRIVVRSVVEGDVLRLTVEDDGQGMRVDTVERMTCADGASPGGMSGVGVANVRERLRLYYGERGTLQYESDGCSYTRAIIMLPVSYDMDEYGR